MAEAQSDDQTYADAVSSPNEDQVGDTQVQTTERQSEVVNSSKGDSRPSEAHGGGPEMLTTETQPQVAGSSKGDGKDRGKSTESKKVPTDTRGGKQVSPGHVRVIGGRRRTSSSSSISQRMSREDIFTADVDTASLLVSAGTSSMEVSGPHHDARNRRLQSKLCCCGLFHCLTTKKCVIGSAVTAIVLIILAVIMYGVAIPRFHYHIKQSTILREGQSSEWQRSTGPNFLTIFYFNVTNNDEFRRGLEPPIVEEKGPYVYRVIMEKINVAWNDNFTVTYEDNHSFEFVESMSNGTQNDSIVTSTSMQSSEESVGLTQKAYLGLEERATGVLQSYTVNELFSRYKSQVLKLSGDAPDPASDVPDLLSSFHTQNYDDNSTDSDNFVYLDTSNRTYGVLNVYTGESNFSRFNVLHSWKYSTILDVWTSDEARELYGTDGFLFSPFVEETSRLTIFDPELFRTFDLEFLEHTTFKGAGVLRFIIPDSELTNGTEINNRTRVANDPSDKSLTNFRNFMGRSSFEKRNKGSGYCTPTCIPSGVYNISTCTGGALLYMSLPHFLGADPYYTNRVVGLKPDELRHRPYYDVHALTGHVLYQRRSHQLNEIVTPPNAPEVFLPLYWAEPSIVASDTTLRQVKEFHLTNSALHTFLYCLLVAVGLAVFHLVAVGGCRMRLIFYNTYNPIPETPSARPPCYCCCHCSPCYKEFTYCMFRMCADD